VAAVPLLEFATVIPVSTAILPLANRTQLGLLLVSKAKTVLLGYEVGASGAMVEIPLKHMAITGQTQEAGKTTALEALIARSGMRAVTFITKRGEASFTEARRIDPYFREQADWQFVASILEASRGEKLKFERAWIIRASRGAKTLADVQNNVRNAMEKARGMSADVYLTLDAYLEVVVPEIAKVDWAKGVDLRDGVNAVDLTELSLEMQHLVIRSTISWVLNREKNTIIVIPEAWKFIPQGRGTPVKLAAEAFIRQGAAMGNYLWLDSQDLGGIEKTILRSVPVWILGVQREANEIKRTLENIPAGFKKPKPADIATLELGQFFACWGHNSIRTYAQPAWLDDRIAMQVAAGQVPVESLNRFRPEPPSPEPPQPEPKESPTTMSFDQQLADASRRVEDFITQIKWAIIKLGGNVDDKWSDDELVVHFIQAIEAQSKPVTATLSGGTPSAGKVQTGPVNIDAAERQVAINFSRETREFRTDGPTGMMMFVLIHDLKNKPSMEKEISDAMIERGWSYSHQMLAPQLAKLVKEGDLIKEGATSGVRYRVPGKLILTIDGKKVQ
jgi:hypothetical protein